MYKDNDNSTRIILVRHGECRGNREGLFRGRSDFPLNERGLIQANELATELKKFKPIKVFTSPLPRARQTARIISQICHISIENREGINNIELGPWEGKSKKYIAQKYPEEWSIWVKEPEKLRISGIETLDNVQQRAKRELENIITVSSGKTVVIVSHRAVLKPLIASCLEINKPYFWRIHIDTAAFSILNYEKQRGYTLTQLNQNRHLSEFVTEYQ